ncbi:DUF5107 domain-containing protein [Haloimpatiens sp. FM7315]|uniref:DUF5107 domain-containing protein n=1 Tax=Haloimpatiens sp. FM7315 TaxID=3298609 RepID=UPI0035A2FEC4
MIYEDKFKNLNSVVLENNFLKLIVLPKLGGKIASIYEKRKDFEVLFQNNETSYKIPELNSPFEKYDASGFDDAFPTIDSCKVIYEGKEILYPDHGEVWSSELEYTIDKTSLSLYFKSSILPYMYTKTLNLEQNIINFTYNIKNLGHSPLPCIWAMHCLVNCKEDMLINFPKGTQKVINVHDSLNLGEAGKIYNYPICKTVSGEDYHLNKVGSKSLNKAEKYYVYNKIEKGYISFYYPSKDIRLEIEFNEKILPYVGFWVTEGGFRGDYNCALEPTNGFYDSISIAKNKGKLFYLKDKEDLNFSITMKLS